MAETDIQKIYALTTSFKLFELLVMLFGKHRIDVSTSYEFYTTQTTV